MHVQQKTAPVSLAIPVPMYAALVKRAAPLNIRPSEYAHRLLNAAWAARVSDERGEESGDAALDRQVKQTFLLADCEPEFIANALGIPQARVERILDGWRTELGRTERAAPSANATPAAVDQAAGSVVDQGTVRKVGRPSGSTDYPVETIRALWREGRSTRDIAEMIGKTEKALANWAHKNRDVCPARSISRKAAP